MQNHFIMKKQPNLKATEQLIWKIVTSPKGVAATLKKNSLSLPILGDERLSAVARVSIYADMYFLRILDSLKEDFPSLLCRLGEKKFDQLISDYLVTYPSSYWTLRNVGQDLPRFLGEKDTKKYRQGRPYLKDLAQFEWALVEAFDAPDEKPVTETILATIPPDQWLQLQLGLVPSCSLHQFQWPVDQLFEAKKRNNKIAPAKTFIIVWRKDLKVFYKKLEAGKFDFLNSFRKKLSFGDVCEGLNKKQDLKISSKIAQQLKHWVEEGVFYFPPFSFSVFN